ncbi:Isotrichodermin C-15 hydroxylase [Talaromyces islandicus]|uniref:Isotrichodermin C-15 hydroxylase n=1 Tax=Talaromyces islandicus TaxID=28573 RepID=A0A0U1LK89_TALIS|nr:Isotrichodermin C-15 hydroxylase [Talaromyces islandicus]
MKNKITSYVLYMTVFHPLAKYPGPFVAKLTDLYSVWHALRGTRHWNFYELHKRYGDFVRWGPNSVSVCSVEALDSVYGPKANVKKSTWYNAFNSVSIFSATDKAVHARKRRVMSHAFSEQAVRQVHPYIISAISIWCDALDDNDRKEWSAPKDMRVWSAYAIFDALGELLFGESFHSSTTPDHRFFLDLMASNSRYINITGQMPILGRLNLSNLMVFARAHKERRMKQFAFLRTRLQQRLALGEDSNGRRDIIHYLQRAKDPTTGEGYSVMELMGESALLLGAGSDTANTSLASIFYFLVHNPIVLDKLQHSIRKSFNSVDEISNGQALTSNTYLRACVDEAMRLCPPVPMLLPREVCAGGQIIMGEYFPAGTVVGVPTYALHHDTRYFQDAFAYNPSRWDENENETLDLQRKAFIPFSLGPRGCIGRHVALFELYLAVARVLFMYDIRLAPGMEQLGVGPAGEYKIKDYFIVGKEGPVVQFRNRL